MDAMIYFLTNSTTLILVLGVVFLLLGLWLGWLLWGRFREQALVRERELAASRSRLQGMAVEGKKQQQRISELQQEIERFSHQGSERQDHLDQLEQQLAQRQQQLAGDHQELAHSLEDLRSELEVEKGNNATLNADLSATAARAEEAERKLASALRERDALKEELRELANHPHPGEPSPPLVMASPAPSAEDADLGLVYPSPPQELDDLSQIKGVGEVLHRKLNEHGVYHFDQIARWNQANIEAFSQLLSFKDRILRDDWVEQAQRLHQEKYGASP